MKTLALVAMLAVAAPAFAEHHEMHADKMDKMDHGMKAEMTSETTMMVSGTEAMMDDMKAEGMMKKEEMKKDMKHDMKKAH